jgi:hypothetical protein
MLKGRTISARPSKTFVSPKTPGDPLDDPFSATAAEQEHAFDITTSSPLCKQIFNIFHPTDPISYRIEPLISPAMAGLKAQPLPYTKKGIFGAPASQGLGGITSRVNQSVNDFWSSLGSGIGSALLNRSLGISGTEVAGAGNTTQGQRSSRPLSFGPGSANTQPGLTPDISEPASAFINEERRKRLGQETIIPGEDGEHPPTLIESEVETLFAGFQKRRKSSTASDVGSTRAELDLEWQELEEKSRKLKREEAKVRNLNANGRVDYSIQEGVSTTPRIPRWWNMLMMVKGFRHKFAGKHRESSCVLGRRRRLAFHDFTVVGETSRVQGEGVMVVRAMEMS